MGPSTLPILIILCGIMCHLRCTELIFFADTDFEALRSSLDAEMKRLQSKGLGSTHKQAQRMKNYFERKSGKKFAIAKLRGKGFVAPAKSVFTLVQA